MFNLIIILLATLNSEPKDSNNYRIAKYIIDHLQTLEDCTLSDLAKHCFVANSSISRFCREIGFKDFNELKIQLIRFQMESKQATNKFHYQTMLGRSLVDSYLTSVIENLTYMVTPDMESRINQLAEDIERYEKVAAFGYMHSENAALSLQYDLQTSRKIIYTSLRFADQVDYLRHASERDLIIIFSDMATYFKRVFARVKPFKDTLHKPKIYMVTGNEHSALEYVDTYIRYHSRHDYASHPYPLMVIASLISLAYASRCEMNVNF